MIKQFEEWCISNAYFILGLIILLSYGWCFFGLDYQDSFYYLNLAKNIPLEQAPYMTLLSSFLTKMLIKLTDGTIIYLRLINLSFYLILFIFPLFLFEKSERKSNVLKAGLLILLFAPFITNILGADTFSTIGVVLSGVLVVKYLQTNIRVYFILLILVISFAILARFPNILLIPVLVFTFIANDLLNKVSIESQWKEYVVIVIGPIFLCIIVYLSVYRNFDFLIVKRSNVTNESYSLSVLLKSYLLNATVIVKYGLGLVSVYLLSKYVVRTLKLNVKLENILEVVLFILVGILLYNKILFKPSYHRLFGLIIVSIICISVVCAVKKNWNHTKIIFPVMVLLIMFVAPAGSNTGLYKIVYALPLFLIISQFTSELVNRKVFAFVLILVPIALVGRMHGVFQDDPVYKLTETVNLPELKGIYTSQLRKNNIEEIVIKINKNDDKTIVFGNSSHIINYLVNVPWIYTSFIQEIDKEKIFNFQKSESNMLFYINSYPDNINMTTDSYMDIMSEKNLKKLSINDNYLILKK